MERDEAGNLRRNIDRRALDKFEAFASENGPRFYRLPLNNGTVMLERAPVDVPAEISGLVPFHAGEMLGWRLAG